MSFINRLSHPALIQRACLGAEEHVHGPVEVHGQQNLSTAPPPVMGEFPIGGWFISLKTSHQKLDDFSGQPHFRKPLFAEIFVLCCQSASLLLFREWSRNGEKWCCHMKTPILWRSWMHIPRKAHGFFSAICNKWYSEMLDGLCRLSLPTKWYIQGMALPKVRMSLGLQLEFTRSCPIVS